MARHSAREIGQIESTYTSDLGQLTWAWVLKADGRVLYRLSHINGRPERNYWRLVYQLNATERWQIEQDSGRAAGLLARLAEERGHHLPGNPAEQRRRGQPARARRRQTAPAVSSLT